MQIFWGISVIIALIIGVGIGYVILPVIYTKRIDQLKEFLHNFRKEETEKAEREARQIIESAKAEASALIKNTERKLKGQEHDLERRERNLMRMEEKLAQRLESLDRRQAELDKVKASLSQKEKELDEARERTEKELLRISNLDREEAKQIILKRVEEEMEYELDRKRREMELLAEQESLTRARKIIATALARCSVDHYSDAILTTVDIRKDEMKGRIIGREGRNIRTLEQLTGVDIIIDDSPNVVVLSSFDPIRREVAKIAIERLISDGRIHPAKIEDVVEKAKEEVEEAVWQAGQEAVFKTGITGLHPELIKLLGRLKFRTSFGQNILSHSIEIAFIASAMATELGLDPTNVKRGALLHDIGKAVDAEVEGTHQAIGMELAARYGENEVVCNVVGAHHGDIEQTIEAAIVQAADAISASRPGARGEALEMYLKRLQRLEEIGNSFSGVEKCYAIQAGRELRVFVKPDTVDDVVAYGLCRKITKRIQEELEYPGVIKVVVIRELREIEYAK